MRVLPVVLLLLCCLPAKAQDDKDKMDVGRGVVCGTVDQVKRFIALRSDGKEQNAALLMVNGESAQSGACNLGLVMFDNAEAVGEAVLNGRAVTIVKITVRAVGTGHDWREVSHIVRFTAVPQRGRIA